MKQKFIIIVVIIICFVIGGIGGYFGKDFIGSKTFSKEQKMVIEDALIKAQVQQANSMLETVYEGYQDGMYSLDQAKKMGADLMRNLRYGDNNEGYFFVDTVDGTNVVLYGREVVEGKNRIDSNVGGVYHVREIIKNGSQPGGGFTDYFYTKMGQTEVLPKRCFSILFEPFGWVLGTGYYIGDL